MSVQWNPAASLKGSIEADHTQKSQLRRPPPKVSAKATAIGHQALENRTRESVGASRFQVIRRVRRQPSPQAGATTAKATEIATATWKPADKPAKQQPTVPQPKIKLASPRLERADKARERFQKIVTELKTTEESYRTKYVEEFLKRLEGISLEAIKNSRERELIEKAISNFKEILEKSKAFSAKLDEAFKNNEVDVEKFAEIMNGVEFSELLEANSKQSIFHGTHMIEIDMKSILSKLNEWENIKTGGKENENKLTLNSIYIAPVQRNPRYPLILNEAIKEATLFIDENHGAINQLKTATKNSQTSVSNSNAEIKNIYIKTTKQFIFNNFAGIQLRLNEKRKNPQKKLVDRLVDSFKRNPAIRQYGNEIVSEALKLGLNEFLDNEVKTALTPHLTKETIGTLKTKFYGEFSEYLVKNEGKIKKSLKRLGPKDADAFVAALTAWAKSPAPPSSPALLAEGKGR